MTQMCVAIKRLPTVKIPPPGDGCQRNPYTRSTAQKRCPMCPDHGPDLIDLAMSEIARQPLFPEDTSKG